MVDCFGLKPEIHLAQPETIVYGQPILAETKFYNQILPPLYTTMGVLKLLLTVMDLDFLAMLVSTQLALTMPLGHLEKNPNFLILLRTLATVLPVDR